MLFSAQRRNCVCVVGFTWTKRYVPYILMHPLLIFADTALGHYQSTKLNTQENAPGLIDDLSTEVQILVNIINNSSSDNGKVGFVMYQNDKLFQSRIYESHSGFSKQIFSGNTDGGRTIGVEIAFSPKPLFLLAIAIHSTTHPNCSCMTMPVSSETTLSTTGAPLAVQKKETSLRDAGVITRLILLSSWNPYCSSCNNTWSYLQRRKSFKLLTGRI
ncbi:hypothetical protein Q9233_000942, partial [Columba guinea]